MAPPSHHYQEIDSRALVDSLLVRNVPSLQPRDSAHTGTVAGTIVGFILGILLLGAAVSFLIVHLIKRSRRDREATRDGLSTEPAGEPHTHDKDDLERRKHAKAERPNSGPAKALKNKLSLS
ncbi:hypothetical protein GMORB2_4278 [Geosmithia morbida]|uniref:Uncharacterized protein n=1 Tax=Geosmithia morbida TaxID=1094350 RepID=A0A9P4YYI6_9HYPO|nr:uncharacterized protein GMORB2_4278 [Geosmithia morbida]KAF4125438.1 hypothetical protein GMORB2_4278 [Geosmithia morbida]